MNEADDWSSRVAVSDARARADSSMADTPMPASIARYNCPGWTGDLIAGLPGESDIVSGAMWATEQADEGCHVPQRPAEGITARGRQDMVSECPLHTAMRHLAEAALATFVTVLLRPRLGALVSLVAGVFMVGFELVEILVVGFTPVLAPTQPPAWLQPFYMVVGATIALLGVRLWRAETGSYR